MSRWSLAAICSIALLGTSVADELKKAPAIDKPVMFNTPEADKIISQIQIFPPDNAWNEDIGLDVLRKVKGADFKVVKTTGPNEGPRAKK